MAIMEDDAGPVGDRSLLMKISGVWMTRVISFGVISGVFDAIDARPALDLRAFAAERGFDFDVLQRLLEGYVNLGLVEAIPDGYALTADGKRLTTHDVDSLAPLAALWAGPFDKAWSALPNVARTGQPGFECAHGQTLFGYLNTHPGEARLFEGAMQGLIRTASIDVAVLIAADQPTTLCDVGGGNGALLIDILRRSPTTKGTLFDQVDVIANVRSALPEETIGIASGDFFIDVPPASAHDLANILHDWSDNDAARIVSSVALSQPEDGVIYIVEPILGGEDEPAMARQFDLHMMMLTGGRERSRGELEGLFNAVGYDVASCTPLGEIYSSLKAIRSKRMIRRSAP